MIRSRGLYSIVGAAAVSSSVTKTISPFIIFIELNGHNSHLAPLMFAITASYYVSEFCYPLGFFDVMSELRGFKNKLEHKNSLVAKDILNDSSDKRFTNFEYLTESESGIQDAVCLSTRFIPIVDSHLNMHLLYLVKREEL